MASQLDGAGQIKMATLDDALLKAQHVHAIVERYASAVRLQTETGSFRMQIQRAATPLVGLLKPQFGPVADVVVAFLLAATRGGSEHSGTRKRANAMPDSEQVSKLASKLLRRVNSLWRQYSRGNHGACLTPNARVLSSHSAPHPFG